MTTTREAAMEAALLKTRQLVCEAAEVGFNYADGDWADRLYRNNGNIAAALSTPAADTRVVAVALLDRAMKTTMSGIVRDEIRAIIDTAILKEFYTEVISAGRSRGNINISGKLDVHHADRNLYEFLQQKLTVKLKAASVFTCQFGQGVEL